MYGGIKPMKKMRLNTKNLFIVYFMNPILVTTFFYFVAHFINLESILGVFSIMLFAVLEGVYIAHKLPLFKYG
jgi:hypothetical protein